MTIPALNQDGFLPAGIHDCTLGEIEARFGQFQRTDRRRRLFARLKAFIDDIAATQLFNAVIVDGSFVTAENAPNDIDLILVLLPSHDFAADLRPFEYNVPSKRQVRRQYGIDIVAVREGSPKLDEAIEFFSRVRYRSDFRKGLLKVSI